MASERFKVYEGVFDEFTLKTLETLKRKGYFDELGKIIKPGKEADVYKAYRNDGTQLAVKIFRMTSANFNKISEYIKRDYRFKTSKGNKRRMVLQWCQKEYRNLLKCHECGIPVPFPYKQMNNVIIMDYIEGALLKDTLLENPKTFFNELLNQMSRLRFEAELVHGDLSSYNIIVERGFPVFIDFGQAMSIKNSDEFLQVQDLYQRDVNNIIDFFNKRYKLNLNKEEMFEFLEKEL